MIWCLDVSGVNALPEIAAKEQAQESQIHAAHVAYILVIRGFQSLAPGRSLPQSPELSLRVLRAVVRTETTHDPPATLCTPKTSQAPCYEGLLWRPTV